MNIYSIKNSVKTPSKPVQNNRFAHTFVRENAVNNKNLKNDTFTYSTNPISFKGQETTQKENYKSVVNTLTLFSDSSEEAFNKQYKNDGVFAKTVDIISNLWFSPNRSKLVKKDLETYKNNMDRLNKSIENNSFEKTFEDIFEVKYNQKNIDKFNKTNERLMLASTTKYMADTIDKKLSEDLNIAKKNKGELQEYVTVKTIHAAPTCTNPYVIITTPKEEVYSNMEKVITEAVGGKEVLDSMLKAKDIKPDAKPEEKYKVYCNIGDFLTKTSKMTAEKCSKGKTLEDLRKDYDEAYEEAFGDKNNIQKRVDKYNRSQKIGTTMLKAGVKNPVKYALLGMLGLTNPLATIPISVALSQGLNMLEKATSDNENNKKEGLSKDSVKELMKDTAQSYVNYAIETGMEIVLPNYSTGNEIVNTIISTARNTAVNVTTDMVSEYMTSGKWNSSQIAPRAFVSVVFGQLSPKDELSKNLLSMTKGGVSSALLYDNTNNNSVKQFINKLQVELQKEYMKNPELYSSMKAIAINNPEAFEKMVVDLLQEHIDKKAEEAKNNKAETKN